MLIGLVLSTKTFPARCLHRVEAGQAATVKQHRRAGVGLCTGCPRMRGGSRKGIGSVLGLSGAVGLEERRMCPGSSGKIQGGSTGPAPPSVWCPPDTDSGCNYRTCTFYFKCIKDVSKMSRCFFFLDSSVLQLMLKSSFSTVNFLRVLYLYLNTVNRIMKLHFYFCLPQAGK